MIVKIAPRGKSFSGLGNYLTHDSDKAKTTERVAWTHTLNCANDHVPSAIDEMVWTARNAELLKQEAGIRAGGRAAENTVLHASLNWAPEDEPTREHMIEATEDFLRHMGWDERQAILVAHDDKSHQHVHLMVNAISPTTGLCLDNSFEQRRAQAWALTYEFEHDRIHCEQRLKNAEEREKGPTRPAWMAFKDQEKEFEREEKMLAGINSLNSENQNPENINSGEWKALKDMQRREREIFFANGKSEFKELRNSIYREVREEFRDRWAELYAAQKDGADPEALTAVKAELVADQKAALELRRDEVCKELRESRDGLYRELLDEQRDIRAGLHARQEAGLESTIFIQLVEDRHANQDIAAEFVETGNALVAGRENDERAFSPVDFPGWQRHERTGLKSGTDIAANVGQGLGFGAISLFESLCDGFVGSKPDLKKRRQEPAPDGPNPFEAVIDETRKRQQREQEIEADEERRKKERSYGD